MTAETMNGSHRTAAVTPEEHHQGNGTTAPRSSSMGRKTRRRRKTYVLSSMITKSFFIFEVHLLIFNFVSSLAYYPPRLHPLLLLRGY